MSQYPHKNPFCYAIYEKGQVCMACRRTDQGYECTALNSTDYYDDDCPFFVPICKHRVNNKDGMILCKAEWTREFNECDGHICPQYEEKRRP